jgi:hypothetical protein
MSSFASALAFDLAGRQELVRMLMSSQEASADDRDGLAELRRINRRCSCNLFLLPACAVRKTPGCETRQKDGICGCRPRRLPVCLLDSATPYGCDTWREGRTCDCERMHMPRCLVRGCRDIARAGVVPVRGRRPRPASTSGRSSRNTRISPIRRPPLGRPQAASDPHYFGGSALRSLWTSACRVALGGCRYTEWTTRAAGSGYRSSWPHRLAHPKQPFHLLRESHFRHIRATMARIRFNEAQFPVTP